ncbi:hypothetical protein [Paenibacillus sp. 22594]|uniref:hypothetical protein n=1 Tax=Paenibacillus sp. 22594 TaxID=3453947 RepID=UPI003F87DE42
MKKVLGIIGIGLIAGAAIYALLNKTEKTKNNINTHPGKIPEDFSSDNTVSIINRNDIHGENVSFEDVKASAVGTIYTRHEEASNIMKEAVDIIYSRSEISANVNRDIDKISDEIDKLLSEE